MKRHGDLWRKICERKNIELATTKALEGKPLTRDRLDVVNNREKYIDEIHTSLINETYKFGKLYVFEVNEPKTRVIHCPHFYPDRILHHCLMNVVIDLFENKFIAHTFGSIRGRGVALAAQKIKKAVSNHADSYFLQVDIKQFYHSIDHDVIKQQIRRVIKCKKTLHMFDQIIDVHDEGLAIGVYPSQYLGNLILSPIDHWAKEIARIKHYYRYMDDMLFIVDSKEHAHQLLLELSIEVSKLKLSIKNNVRIAPVKIGIDFIGYRFFPTHTLLRKRIKIKMQRTVRKLREWEVCDAKFKRKTASHFGWCSHANCRNLLRRTFKDKIYLYEGKMILQRLSEKKETLNWFGLSKEKRVSIEELIDKDIAFLEVLTAKIKGEPKVIVKYALPENTDDVHYFITRSDVMKDRLEKDQEHLPFIATIKKVKNYTAYE